PGGGHGLGLDRPSHAGGHHQGGQEGHAGEKSVLAKPLLLGHHVTRLPSRGLSAVPESKQSSVPERSGASAILDGATARRARGSPDGSRAAPRATAAESRWSPPPRWASDCR